MKKLSLVIAASAALIAVPAAQAQEAPSDLSNPRTLTTGEAYALSGETANGAETDLRGGHFVVIIIGGIIVATKSCASNAACKTIATALIKASAKAGGKYIYEQSKPALHRKLCGMGYQKYC